MKTCWTCDRPADHRARRKNHGSGPDFHTWTYFCGVEHTARDRTDKLWKVQELNKNGQPLLVGGKNATNNS